jgi:prepilin-type N-terminal cleavage/methylation domain-containing protein
MMRARTRGFTLIEMMVALLIATVVMGAAYRLLTGNQRFYRAQSQITDVQQNLRAGLLVLTGELRELASAEGDILALASDQVEMRAARGFGVICKPPSVGNGEIVLKNSRLYGYRPIDATRSGVFVWRDGDSLKATDDRWLTATVTDVQSENCSDGTAGTRLRLSVTGGSSQLDSVFIGAPARVWEQVKYELYSDAGASWLGVSTFESGAWSTRSPVIGPLRSGDGLALTFLDAAGNATTTPASVAAVAVVLRGQSLQPINTPGRPVGPYQDSVSAVVTLRNN